MSSDNVYKHFYRTVRLGAAELSDDGGPFGFDVTTALEFDYLIERYQCDAIIETGSNVGDTTEYLARASTSSPATWSTAMSTWSSAGSASCRTPMSRSWIRRT